MNNLSLEYEMKRKRYEYFDSILIERTLLRGQRMDVRDGFPKWIIRLDRLDLLIHYTEVNLKNEN